MSPFARCNPYYQTFEQIRAIILQHLNKPTLGIGAITSYRHNIKKLNGETYVCAITAGVERDFLTALQPTLCTDDDTLRLNWESESQCTDGQRPDILGAFIGKYACAPMFGTNCKDTIQDIYPSPMGTHANGSFPFTPTDYATDIDWVEYLSKYKSITELYTSAMWVPWYAVTWDATTGAARARSEQREPRDGTSATTTRSVVATSRASSPGVLRVLHERVLQRRDVPRWVPSHGFHAARHVPLQCALWNGVYLVLRCLGNVLLLRGNDHGTRHVDLWSRANVRHERAVWTTTRRDERHLERARARAIQEHTI